jgi:hypothetical protein
MTDPEREAGASGRVGWILFAAALLIVNGLFGTLIGSSTPSSSTARR